MKTKLILLLLLAWTVAAINITITPTTIAQGNNTTINITLENDQPIWGLTLKLQENTTINFLNATPTNRLNGGLNGATVNNQDKITLYTVFASNTPGIQPGTDTIFTLTYEIPENTPTGTYTLEPTQLTASDQNGNPIIAITSPSTITVTEKPKIEFVLPQENAQLNTEQNISVCLTNTYDTAITNATMTITNDANIAEAKNATITHGTGTITLQPGNVKIDLTSTNITDSNCDQNTGTNIATITYKAKKIGITTLEFQNALANYQNAQPLTLQANAKNGQLSVSNTAQSSSKSSSSGAGGSENNKCATCNNPTYPRCCAPDIKRAEYFCQQPEAYPVYCKSTTTEQTVTPFVPTFNIQPPTLEETPEKPIEKQTQQNTTNTTQNPINPIKKTPIALVLMIATLAIATIIMVIRGKRQPPKQEQQTLHQIIGQSQSAPKAQ